MELLISNSFESNTESHFMCLPAELRNRIYSLLLAGHTIHVPRAQI